jgi:RNA polymerase sigma-70 factor (ECF subfamily)
MVGRAGHRYNPIRTHLRPGIQRTGWVFLPRMAQRRDKLTKEEFEAEALKHLDALYGSALRFTRDPRDAEDLVQDVFVRACRFLDRFEPGTNLKAWLFRILANTFINRYRRTTRERSLVDGPGREQVTDQLHSPDAAERAEQPERALLDRLVSDEVLAALDAVPIDFRMVVILSDIQDFSYKEIAEILDVPVGTVMSRLYRGRRILQRALAGHAAAAGFLLPEPPHTGERIDLDAWRKRRAGADG